MNDMFMGNQTRRDQHNQERCNDHAAADTQKACHKSRKAA